VLSGVYEVYGVYGVSGTKGAARYRLDATAFSSHLLEAIEGGILHIPTGRESEV